jgi:catechol 2,3-dioxygenase-like lactoylglutathione lyase family enzyme
MMRFHHMCAATTDIDRAVRFQQDPMGSDVAVRMSITGASWSFRPSPINCPVR